MRSIKDDEEKAQMSFASHVAACPPRYVPHRESGRVRVTTVGTPFGAKTGLGPPTCPDPRIDYAEGPDQELRCDPHLAIRVSAGVVFLVERIKVLFLFGVDHADRVRGAQECILGSATS